DWSFLRSIAMEGFQHDNAARFERALDQIRHSAAADVAQHNQVPAAFAEIEILPAFDFRVDTNAELARILTCQRHGFFRRIETGHVPSLLSKPNTIAPLPHADIQSRAWLASFYNFHQERVRLDIEAWLFRCEDFVPAFGFI